MQVAEITTQDGFRVRTGCWRGRGEVRADCLIFPGRSEFLEKYGPLAEAMADAGFRTCAVDWRGQGLSQRFDVPTTAGHVEDFDQYCLDMDAAADHWMSHADRPLLVFAHSMGAPVALRWLVSRGRRAAGVVLSSPMFRLHSLRRSGPIVRRVARRAVRRGRAADFASRAFRAWDPGRETFAGNPLTGDAERFRVKPDFFARHPAAAVGGPTWGWLDAAFRGVQALKPRDLARIDCPVLVALAGADRLVVNRATLRAVRYLPDVRLARFEGARHELHMERDAIRTPYLETVLGFLREVL
ncbi:MAG: alpha/beta hydrolase [Azospirillaceae bacterium]